ncbi:hypothetical protein SAMN05421760_102186 [Neptunomonas antarctica]|uniref:Uncharacterized protein n=1 Tax=Neptunomonas antarctica TaxID=619304 RepID=A0A1N7K4C9_9GAMM|nr:hypothetical protein SAMN05421760_102186 [Neptunomonas antarctica]
MARFCTPVIIAVLGIVQHDLSPQRLLTPVNGQETIIIKLNL